MKKLLNKKLTKNVKNFKLFQKNMRKLFISTGGFKDLTPTQADKKLNKNNIFNIELSGGKYEKNVENKILRINTKII